MFTTFCVCARVNLHSLDTMFYFNEVIIRLANLVPRVHFYRGLRSWIAMHSYILSFVRRTRWHLFCARLTTSIYCYPLSRACLLCYGHTFFLLFAERGGIVCARFYYDVYKPPSWISTIAFANKLKMCATRSVWKFKMFLRIDVCKQATILNSAQASYHLE